jgi:DNA primase small subunit
MPDAAEELLKRLPSALAPALRKKWGTGSVPSRQRWRDVDDVVRDGSVTEVAASTLLEAKQDIIFEYLYPRLDIEVSKHLNHLLKSPFCVHPSTGRVCVPIDPQRTGEFDPLGVPTVQVLLDELNEYTILHKDSPDGSQERTHDYDKTSLKEYVDIFADFVNNLLKAEQRTKRSRDDASLDF